MDATCASPIKGSRQDILASPQWSRQDVLSLLQLLTMIVLPLLGYVLHLFTAQYQTGKSLSCPRLGLISNKRVAHPDLFRNLNEPLAARLHLHLEPPKYGVRYLIFACKSLSTITERHIQISQS